MLGAIVNPNAFLPYATASMTFVTVVSSKATQFNDLATNGFDKVIEYVKSIASA